MTQSIDNSEAVMQGVIRDPVTGALLRVNADGSINVGGAGGVVGTGTTVTGGASITLNTAGIAFNGSGLAGTGVTTGSTIGTVIVATLNSAGLSILNPEPLISSFEPFIMQGSNNVVLMNGASQSYARAFFMPQNGSFSFLRMPVSMTTGSTTYGTTGATLNASVQIGSTWNAVVYSLGTGASSRSLISVASGSASFLWQNSMSVAANGTQYSISQNLTYNVEGATASSSSSYAISNTNYSFVSTLVTDQTGNRMLDIQFAASLSAGPYWLVVGYTSTSGTNSTGISLASGNNVSFSVNYMGSGFAQAARIMGSTNGAIGNFGAGSFSTAGGGTTSGFPISAISSSAGNPSMYWQMLRSA